MNSRGIVYPYLSTPIGKPFLISIVLKVFELSLPTTITVMMSVSCDHVTSFNYDGKKATDVGLTC